MQSVDLEAAPTKLEEWDSELKGKHDIVILLHVDQLAKDLLSSPGNIFKEPVDESMELPMPGDDIPPGAGAGPDEFVGET